ncbi:MAG TPA: class I SAM-dependent methyltransferase [Anaerolineales bacterium]|nr:class I SAM-dependent methyltransferase [Anaerolineales bacterium]
MDWHARYQQQAAWTRDLRTYLFDKAGLANARRVLEVGCGTGAILRELETPASIHGLDLNPDSLAECQIHAPNTTLTRGNGLALPYPNQTFDITYCHYFLLWVTDPLWAVLEMKRVMRKHGHILALAEPDYFARVDRPDELRILGDWQSESLKRQGADPGFGARLAETFFQAGIKIHETGIIQSVRKDPTADEREMEWAVIGADLLGSVSDEEIQKMKRIDEQAWENKERILHVPTYFVWGQI